MSDDLPAEFQAVAEEGKDALRVTQLLQDGIEWEVKNDKGKPIPGVANCKKFLDGVLDAKKLRFNEYLGELEVSGKRLVTDSKVDQWRAQIEKTSGVGKWTEGDFGAALRLLTASVTRYHPIREYLESCAEKWDRVERINGMVGTVIPIRGEAKAHHHRYLEVFLFGAVCRIMRPGCKFDASLILLGREGIRKSSLFSSLVPVRDWFIDTMPPLGDKDAMMAIQTAWIIEWAELESIRKANSTAIKAFLTSQFDTYRAPYGKKIEKHPRKCVFSGSTNEEEYLISTTGNRRFMTLAIADLIDTDWIVKNRDQIWGEALTKCREAKYNGITLLKLDAETESAQREDNAQYSPTNEWEEPTMEWLTQDKTKEFDGKRYITTTAILDGLKIPIERRAQAQKSIGNVLRDHGWRNMQRRLFPGANPIRIFVAPDGWSQTHWERMIDGRQEDAFR